MQQNRQEFLWLFLSLILSIKHKQKILHHLKIGFIHRLSISMYID